MDAGGDVTRTVFTTCLVEAYLAVGIPSDQEGDQLWREASSLLSQFRSDLSRPKPAPQQRPPHGGTLVDSTADPLRRLASLLSSHPHIASLLSHGYEAAGGSGGWSGLAWLCSGRTRALMYRVVDTVWPTGSINTGKAALSGTARHIVECWTSDALLAQLKDALTAAAGAGAVPKGVGLLRSGSIEPPLSRNAAQTGIAAVKAAGGSFSESYKKLLESEASRITLFNPIEGKSDPLLVQLNWPAVLDSYRLAARGMGPAEFRPAAAAAATAINRPVAGVAPASSYAGGIAPKQPPVAAALNPAGGASTPLTSGVIAMDALVAAVKAALPERGGAGRSGERGGPDAGLDLRTALKLRHAALFVLQECGLGLGDTAALVHVNQFRKCRVTLPKLALHIRSRLLHHPAFAGDASAPGKGLLTVLADPVASQGGSGAFAAGSERWPFVVNTFPTDGQATQLVGLSSRWLLRLMGERDAGQGLSSDIAGAAAASAVPDALPLSTLLAAVDRLLPLPQLPKKGDQKGGASSACDGPEAAREKVVVHLAAAVLLQDAADQCGFPKGGEVWLPKAKLEHSTMLLTVASEAIVSALASERYRSYRHTAGATPTKGILALLKQYSSAAHRSATPSSQGLTSPDAFRLLLDKRTAWIVGINSMTFWRAASTAAGATASSPFVQLPASYVCTLPPPPIAPSAGTNKCPQWRSGLTLSPEVRARLAALPPASVRDVITACDAAVTAEAAYLRRSNAAAAAAAATAAGAYGGGVNDDDDGWSEVRRPGARHVSGGRRSDASILMRGLVRTVMKAFTLTFSLDGQDLIEAQDLALYRPSLNKCAEYVSQHLPPAGDGNEGGDRGIVHHHYKAPAPAVVTVTDLQEAVRSTTEQLGGGTSGGGTSGRPVSPVFILHASTASASGSDKKPRVSLNVESVWAFLPGGSGSGGGGERVVGGGSGSGGGGAVQVVGGGSSLGDGVIATARALGGGLSAPAAPRLEDTASSAVTRVMLPLPFPSSLTPTPPQGGTAGTPMTYGGGAASYAAAAPYPAALRAQAAAAEPSGSAMTGAPVDTMTFDDGLPPFWCHAGQLDEARRLLLSAAELVWPPPPSQTTGSSRGGGTGGGTADGIPRSFLCGHVAERAVATGIDYHLQQLSSPGGGAPAGQMGGGVRHEPETFVALLAVAGQQAFEAWQQCGHSTSGGGGGRSTMQELWALRGCSSPEAAVERAISEWQQSDEQRASQGRAAPLLQLVTAAGDGSGGGGGRGSGGAVSPPVVLVRLDVAGLLDLASSIQLAEELASGLLI